MSAAISFNVALKVQAFVYHNSDSTVEKQIEKWKRIKHY